MKIKFLHKAVFIIIFLASFWPGPSFSKEEFAQDLSYTYLIAPTHNLKALSHSAHYELKPEASINKFASQLLISKLIKENPYPIDENKKMPLTRLPLETFENIASYVFNFQEKRIIQISFQQIVSESEKGIRYSLDVMKTPVTQWQYLMTMADEIYENPAYFKDGKDSIKVEMRGKKFIMQPNHPIEQISEDEVQRFIAKLEELDKSADPLIYKLIPDHQSGDKYRLPTETEYELLAIGDEPDWWINQAILDQRTWHRENNGLAEEQYGTHPVGQKQPNGFGLYDILGNVWHLTTSASDGFAARGGGWDFFPQVLSPLARVIWGSSSYSNLLGLRLIRERHIFANISSFAQAL